MITNSNLSMICSLLILCFPSLLLPVVSGKMTMTTLLRSSVTSSSNLRGDGVEDNNEQEEHDRQLRPILCGCLSCDAAAWQKIAGDYSCGARITWLQTTQNLSEREACTKVAGAEFPNDCSPCNPQTCDPSIVSRPTPSPLSRPTPSPLSRPTQLVPDVGDSFGVYTTTVLNKTGKPLFFKIGPAEQPQLCQSTGIVPNPSSTDSGTYTFAGTGGAVLPPLCDMAVLASEACSETLTGDNVQGTINICDLKGGTACQCIYTAGAGHCEPKELCKYCKQGLVTKGPNPSTDNKVICVEQTDFSPVYEVGVEQVALITRTGDGSGQRLVASDAPFGWNPFEAEANGQTLFELTFGGNRIYYDISLIPSGCDDIPHPGSGWQSQLGWGKQADCSSLPANSISSSCPRCKDNNPPAFNFGGKMTCESGGFPFSCLGPVEGTWSAGNGQGWPTFCGNPDTSCDNFAQPTEQNEGCPQAYFHPRFTPVYGSDKQPTSNCNAFSPITISICDPTKSTCDPIIVSRPTPSPLSRPTQLVPDDTNTNCGCPNECTTAVWNRMVDGYSCGQRITWLQTESARIVGGPFTAQDSCRKVATDEFPNACGPCDPTTCTDTQNPTRSPSLRPTVSPTAAPTTIAPTQTPTVSPTKTPTQAPTMMTNPPIHGPTTSSHVSNTVTIINKTPIIKQGATIYDKIDQASISIFGTPSCPSSGCVVQGGETFHVENMGAGTDDDLTYFLLGLQWNIARMASSDHGLCDNACRQIRVDWTTCTFVQYETSGTCYTNAAGIENYTPRWYPDINMVQQATTTTSTGNNNTTTTTTTCILTVTQNSVMEIDGTTGQEPDTCGCADGAYPCICGPTPDDTCVGQCSGDITTNSQCNPFEAANSKPDDCCFCEGKTGSNTCSATVTATARPSTVPTLSPTEPTPVEEVCGCPTTSCTDAVLNTFAGDYTCRARMDYLQTLGFTDREACATVAGVEFPSECGGCDPDRCEEIDFFTPDYNNNPSSSSSYDDEDTRKHPICGGAVNTSSDKQRECQTNLWNPTDDATMHCFGYGGTDDPCHLNNNNDPNDGRDKDPSLCLEDTLYLWDEPDTQQRSYSWAGRTWLEYSQRFATELRVMKARGTKVTSPMLQAGGPGVLRQNLQEFFDACGPACFDLEDPAYIDIIAINAFCGDFNGPAGCRGGAAFIYNEALATSNVFVNLPVYITNWSRLQTSNPEDQLEAIEAIDAFFPSTNNNNNNNGTDNRIVQRVYWFGATDFGGGSSNNFLTTVLNDGTSLGEHWRSKCDSLATSQVHANTDDILQQVVVNNSCPDDVWFRESYPNMKIPGHSVQTYNTAEEIHTTHSEPGGNRFSFAKWDCFAWNMGRGGDRTCVDDSMALVELNMGAGQQLAIGSPVIGNWNFNTQTGFINLGMTVLVTTLDDEPSCITPGGSYHYPFSDCDTIGGKFVPATGGNGDGYCTPPEGSRGCQAQAATSAGETWQDTLRDGTFTTSDNNQSYNNCLPSKLPYGSPVPQNGATQNCANKDATFFCNPDANPWPPVGFLFDCTKPQQKITITLTCE